MKKQLGILVHPGWSTLGKDDNIKHIEEYIKTFDKFDNVIVFAPKVNPKLRYSIFKSFTNEVVDFYLYGKNNEVMNRALRKEGIKLIFDILKNKLKISKSIKDPALLKHAYKIKLLKFIRRGYMKDLIEKNLCGSMFEGDQSFLDGYEEQDKLLNSIGKKVIVMEFGSIISVNQLSKLIYEKFDKDEFEITLFGEYYNQCVKSHSFVLDEFGFNYTIDKSLSVYNTAKYIKHDDNIDLSEFKHVNETLKEHQK